MQQPTPAFYVASTPVFGDLILAPMNGYSDLPYRWLCRQFGSSMSYIAFIGAIDVLERPEQIADQLRYLPDERPVVFQIFDNDEERLLKAGKRIQVHKPDLIDINLGCPTRRVAGRGAGAGMLKDPQQIASTVRTLSSELETPISAKIRLGWDQQNRNYLQIAKILEDNGASLIAVHGRTKNQGYEQQADWDAIAEVKSHLTIPVVGNGDVETVSDIARMKEHTNCDGIMIGRAAMGNPWIFQRRDRMTISKSEWAQVVYGHLSYMRKFYGTQRGLILFRKHLTHYLAPFELPNTTRKALLTRRRLSQLLDLLEHVGFPSPRSTTHQDTFDPLPACEAVQVS